MGVVSVTTKFGLYFKESEVALGVGLRVFASGVLNENQRVFKKTKSITGFGSKMGELSLLPEFLIKYVLKRYFNCFYKSINNMSNVVFTKFEFIHYFFIMSSYKYFHLNKSLMT